MNKDGDVNAQHGLQKYSHENKRLIWDNFQIAFLCGHKYAVSDNYNHIKFNKLVQHKILIHLKFNINLLREKIGR